MSYPYPDNQGQTHSAGCYRDRHHHNCAVREVDRLLERIRSIERYADGLHFAGRLDDEKIVRAALASGVPT